MVGNTVLTYLGTTALAEVPRYLVKYASVSAP
jgi:hypothetical protein